MKPLPPQTRAAVPMGFLILRDGRIIFDGDLKRLRETQDPYIREYIS
jgi:ABC-type transporter Mla maintaining outer membrane lipid asymmetry ATPase subunit MlaF